MQDYNKGIALMIFTTFIFAIQDTTTKLLGNSMPVLQFLGIRYLVFFGFAVWWTTRKRPLRAVVKVKNVPVQLLRGVLLGLESLLFAWALTHIGVGQMHSIFACFPLMVTALSPLFLGEKVGLIRWLGILVGFLGTLVIIAPGSVSFSVYSWVAVGCAVLFAIYSLLTRYVASTDSADSSLFYTGLMAAAVTAPFLPFFWEPMTLSEGLIVAALCLLGILSHYSMIHALKYTPAVVLQPFNYFVLPWVLLFGFLVFGEVVSFNQLLGVCLVVGSGLFIIYYQRRLKA
ncbi:DMT family transporter [uncultured Thiothrix sp.]|uniref:DMT family transporter n=1 Tax=uncultured Thiothrix sp. TaxID=223185 RepID=UPI00262460FF|nr:DMT family transporter [uncultured Thiothrix sp.]HMT92713.1 DMT family transporter [Thiolinea sp.]